MMLKFMEIKSSELKSAQKEISKQLGSSDSTIERYRDDVQLDFPYRIFPNSNQRIKCKEIFFDDSKIKIDKSDQVCADSVKEHNCSQKDLNYKKISINRFIKVLNINKRELQLNKWILWKKLAIIIY